MLIGFRRAAVAALLALAVLAGAAAGVATGASGSTKGYTLGDPQPELAPFNVGDAGGGATSGAVLRGRHLRLTSLSTDGTMAVVCTLHPGGQACATTTTLGAYVAAGVQDSFSGVPEVVATGGSDVTVVIEDCCHVPAFGGTRRRCRVQQHRRRRELLRRDAGRD